MKKQQSVKPKESVQVALIEIPFTSPTRGAYCDQEARTRLTPRQAAALKAVYCRLEEDGEFCDMEGVTNPKGKRVEKERHAIRYILDQVADSIEADGVNLLRDFDLKF